LQQAGQHGDRRFVGVEAVDARPLQRLPSQYIPLLGGFAALML
jgi:hypothetical protein